MSAYIIGAIVAGWAGIAGYVLGLEVAKREYLRALGRVVNSYAIVRK